METNTTLRQVPPVPMHSYDPAKLLTTVSTASNVETHTDIEAGGPSRTLPTMSGQKWLHVAMVMVGLVTWFIFMVGAASTAAKGMSYTSMRMAWWSLWYMFFLLLGHGAITIMGKTLAARTLLLALYIYNLFLLTDTINWALRTGDVGDGMGGNLSDTLSGALGGAFDSISQLAGGAYENAATAAGTDVGSGIPTASLNCVAAGGILSALVNVAVMVALSILF